MALTHSTMLELGTIVPDFQLPDVVSGEMISPGQFAGQKGLLVMFICRHCPYVIHVQQELGQLGRDYAGKSLGVIAISSNDVDNYPDDHPERLRAHGPGTRVPVSLLLRRKPGRGQGLHGGLYTGFLFVRQDEEISLSRSVG